MLYTYKIFGEIIVLNTKEKYIQVNGNAKVTFERLNEIITESKNVNRFYKPIGLLIYTDYKNGKINNYKDNLISQIDLENNKKII